MYRCQGWRALFLPPASLSEGGRADLRLRCYFSFFYIDRQPCVNFALSLELFLLPPWRCHIFCVLNFWVSSSSTRLPTVCILYCTFQWKCRWVSRQIFLIHLTVYQHFCLVFLLSFSPPTAISLLDSVFHKRGTRALGGVGLISGIPII